MMLQEFPNGICSDILNGCYCTDVVIVSGSSCGWLCKEKDCSKKKGRVNIIWTAKYSTHNMAFSETFLFVSKELESGWVDSGL